MVIKAGICVRIPDGRVGRVRNFEGSQWRVRVQRVHSNSHQFLYFKASQLKTISCPKGWMSVQGYNNYLKVTLAKMKKRSRKN